MVKNRFGSKKTALDFLCIKNASICFCLLFLGCNTSELAGQNEESESVGEQPILLTWSEFDGDKSSDENLAVYKFNGKEMGTGVDGFKAVIKEIELIKIGTEIMVYPDKNLLNITSTHDAGSGSGIGHRVESVPFRRNAELFDEFLKKANNRNLEVWFLAGAPGTYTLDNGEDLKIRAN